jgi:hypothetical protein
MKTDTERTRIYISYPHNAEKNAQHLAEFLEDVGFEVSFKKEEFGEKWENGQAMQNSISNSHSVIVCIVKKSFINIIFDLLVRHPFKRRKFFKREISHALRISFAKPPKNNFLMVCRLEKCRVPKRLNEIPQIDLFESEGYEDLVDHLTAGMEHQGRILKSNIRSRPRNNLSIYDAMRLIRLRGYFNKEWNDDVDGFNNECDFDVQQGDKIFIEKTTGRMWQRHTSSKFSEAKDAQDHINHLNEVEFAGYNDWRLPSLDEALTLMRKQIDEDFFIDLLVHDRQNWILTADQDDDAFWVVNHKYGICRIGQPVDGISVRAVRFDEKRGSFLKL